MIMLDAPGTSLVPPRRAWFGYAPPALAHRCASLRDGAGISNYCSTRRRDLQRAARNTAPVEIAPLSSAPKSVRLLILREDVGRPLKGGQHSLRVGGRVRVKRLSSLKDRSSGRWIAAAPGERRSDVMVAPDDERSRPASRSPSGRSHEPDPRFLTPALEVCWPIATAMIRDQGSRPSPGRARARTNKTPRRRGFA